MLGIIEPPRTNQFPNGDALGAGHIGAFTIVQAGVTRSADSTVPTPNGTNSIKYVCDGTAAGQGALMASVNGLAYAVGLYAAYGFWFLGVNGAAYTHFMFILNADSSQTLGASTNFNATGAWQFLRPTAVQYAAGKTGNSVRAQVVINGTRNESFWVGNPMAQAGGADATVYGYVPTQDTPATYAIPF